MQAVILNLTLLPRLLFNSSETKSLIVIMKRDQLKQATPVPPDTYLAQMFFNPNLLLVAINIQKS